MIRMDSITDYDDIYSDPMNGQRQQDRYFHRHGARLLRRQLLSLPRKEDPLRIANEKRIMYHIFIFCQPKKLL